MDINSDAESAASRVRKKESRALLFIEALFLMIALIHLDGPFVSAHSERQNQTFDMSRQVFRRGWDAVWTPRVSFSMPGYEAKPYLVTRQEFPFYGVLGWPLVKLFGHEQAVARLIATFFGLVSIHFLYLILRHWLKWEAAIVGATLWAFSPLLLHLGQSPMPDILCTAGMLVSFWAALKGNTPVSSGAFLFSILAKLSTIIFGLPILAALLCARQCKTLGQFIRISLVWGVVPLAGLLAWSALEWRDPDAPWTVKKLMETRGGMQNVLSLRPYFLVLACLVPFGLGLMGAAAAVAAPRAANPATMDWRVKWAIIASNVIYLFAVVTKIPELQYMLPPLAWAAIAVGFGVEPLIGLARAKPFWRAALGLLVGVQLLTVTVFAFDLKASRVPDFSEIQAAEAQLPAGARVMVIYPYYGASPAVWLNRNVLSVYRESVVEEELPKLRPLGFTHIILLDLKLSDWVSWRTRISALFHGNHPQDSRDPAVSRFADPASSIHQYCDRRFTKIYSAPYVVLYSVAEVRP
jgi:Dolichyl-phosphate-mannose-protein mannosyltransferase